MRERTKTVRRWNGEAGHHEYVEIRTGKYLFTEEDKIAIVAEYVQDRVPASQILEKYHIKHRQTLLNWVDKYVYEQELVSLHEETNPSDPMAKQSPEDRVKELEAENKRLQKALELEKLRSKAYDTMIDVAEETSTSRSEKNLAPNSSPAAREHPGIISGCSLRAVWL